MTSIHLPVARRYAHFQAFLSFPSFVPRVGIDTDGQLAIRISPMFLHGAQVCLSYEFRIARIRAEDVSNEVNGSDANGAQLERDGEHGRECGRRTIGASE